MILDIRYHIASLVAVFLALGLGILIGASLLDEGRFVESQERLVAGLEKRFDTLQAERSLLETENAKLMGRLQEQENLLVAFELPLVEGVLAGRTVSVIYANKDWREGWQAVIDKLLKQADAQVVANSVISELLQGGVIASLPDENGEEGPSSTEEQSLKLQALADDVRGLLGGRTTPIQTDVSDVLLMVGTGGDKTETWEKQMAKEALALGIAVAVVGNTDMEAYLHELAEEGVLAMDNLDSVTGRVGLIRGLLVGQVGYYGVGKSAKGPWPPP